MTRSTHELWKAVRGIGDFMRNAVRGRHRLYAREALARTTPDQDEASAAAF